MFGGGEGYWLLQQRHRVIRQDRPCQRCGSLQPIGETMEYRVEVMEGAFFYGYSCFICVR